MLNIFEFSWVWENVEFWLIYANEPFLNCPTIFLNWHITVTVITVIISLYFNKTKKQINCFIYIALGKHCWVIKLGEFKSDQNTLPDKLGNPESPKK